MAIDFPNSPTTNQTFTVGTRTWIWDGTTWELVATSSDPIQKTIVDAKGDLIAGTTSDAVARLAVGTNGQVLTADSGETTGLKWAAGSALTKITAVAPSSVTGVNIDNCFTSTYRHYFIVANIIGTTYNRFEINFRAGGSTDTANSYVTQELYASSTTVGGLRTTATYGRIASTNNGGPGAFVLYVFNPQESVRTTYLSHAVDPSGASDTNLPINSTWAGVFNATTAFDGIRFSSVSGANNFSGNIVVYGLEK